MHRRLQAGLALALLCVAAQSEDFQEYVGGQYHAMEIFNTFYRAADLLDPTIKRIGDSRLAWQRVSQMLPWMKMGDRPGLMVFNATGFSTFNPEKLAPSGTGAPHRALRGGAP